MLYPTLSQPKVILIVLCTAAVASLIISFFKTLTFLSGGDKYSKNIFDFLATIASFSLLYFANLIFNYGRFRIYIIVVFMIGLSFCQFLSNLLWTKLLKKWYNNLKRKWDKRKSG